MQTGVEEFQRTIIEVAGEDGRRWLAELPSILAACAARWSLRICLPCFDLSYNYVVPVVRDNGEEAVLKLGLPGPERDCEREALRLFDGRGMVRLIESDPSAGAMLLERLRPGDPLPPGDAAAISITAGLMRQYWRPPPEGYVFPSLADWAEGLRTMRDRFGGGTGPLPIDLVERAEGLFQDLLASTDAPVLLHGDLHYGNILTAERAPWIAIDPKGVVGDSAYDTATLLCSLVNENNESPSSRRMFARDLDRLTEELELDRERILGWAIAQSVLSAWWMIEDHGRDWEPAIACAGFLVRGLKR
ncbi:MAG TPA: aminoglycoside phosphotransferase family protein [Armatimonadota bacterium]|nr:aminoglycoside phosphotransferase family protein [Armatimonadota bacterium]